MTLSEIPGFGEKCGDPFFCVVCERLAAKAGLLKEYLAEQDRLDSDQATSALPDWMGDV